MILSLAAVMVAYAIGSVPVAYLAGRVTAGVDLREHGSGSVGASNVWQTASKWLVVPVGLAQIAQGIAAVLIAKALDGGEGVQVACGVAAVIANDWNPWLRLEGGRGIGITIGALLVLSPLALGAFIIVALAGVIVRSVPQGVALALLVTPIAASVTGDSSDIVVGSALLTATAFAKRLLANGAPDASLPRPEVWMHRLILDRDIRDRDAWVRRGNADPARPDP